MGWPNTSLTPIMVHHGVSHSLNSALIRMNFWASWSSFDHTDIHEQLLVSLHGIVLHLEDLCLCAILLLLFNLILCLKGLYHTYPIQKYVPFQSRAFDSHHSVPSGLRLPFPQVECSFPGNGNIEALTWTITLTLTLTLTSSLSSFQIRPPTRRLDFRIPLC